MTAQLSISVVIPVYNDCATIERAVQSVLAQTYPVFEIIIVDDGSTDDLTEALLKIPQHAYRLLSQASNKGASAARNIGIKASSGAYVAFLDADDTWRPEKLASQMEVLKKADSDVAACAAGFALHRTQSDNVETYIPVPSRPFIRDLVWGCKISPGSTIVVRRDCYQIIGYYDEALRRLEDWDWLLRFSEKFAVTSVPSILSDIYLGGTVGPYHLKQVVDAIGLIRKKHLSKILKQGFAERQKFLSTLYVERSAAYYRSGNGFSAIRLIVLALLIWPFQKKGLFIRLFMSFCNLIIRLLQRIASF